MRPVKDFLGKEAPAGYIAGAGRVGFTTRPDAEAARMGAANDDSGDEGLLDSKLIDPEDIEADKIYSQIEKVMSERRKKKIHEPTPLPDRQANDPTKVFTDLKSQLSKVTAEEWASIPEAGDRRTKKMKKETLDRFTPVPDSIILSTISHSSSYANDGAFVREKMLGTTLDRLNSYFPDASVAEEKDNILSNLNSQIVAEDSLERARILIRGMLKGNPDNPDSWIAAIRLEVNAGRYKTARKISKQAVDRINDCPDLWLEYCSIAEDKRIALNNALTFAAEGNEVWEPVWVAAVEAEHTVMSKQLMIKKALKNLPRSSKLWALLLNLADPGDRLVLLSRACEACPRTPQFWTMLADAETDEHSLAVLNSGIKHNPSDLGLWLNIVKRISSKEAIQSAIAQCSLHLDSVIPDLPEARLVVKEMLEQSNVELATLMHHSNSIVRSCALEAICSSPSCSMQICLQAVQLDPSLAFVALSHHPASRDLWLLVLRNRSDLFEEALRHFPEDEEIWKLYLEGNPADVRLAERAYSCVRSGDIAYRYIALLGAEGNKVLSDAVSKYPSHEGLLLTLSGYDQSKLSASLKSCPHGIHLWVRLLQQSPNQTSFRAVWERAHKANPKNELLWYVLLQSLFSPSVAAQAIKECPASGMLLREKIRLEGSNRAVRKGQAVEALKALPNDPYVLLIVAEALEEEGRRMDADDYFHRALLCAGKYADVYAIAARNEAMKREALSLYSTGRPVISAVFPDRIDFSFQEIFDKVGQK